MPSLTTAYNWAVATCNNPNVGYSQVYRRGQTVNGITYYDCSSFVAAALTAGGFFQTNPWFTTYNMTSYLLNAGFTRYNPVSQPWAKGDIMWTQEHTEMVYDPVNYVCMGAHSNSFPLDYQVSVSRYSTHNYWTYGFHYSGGEIIDDYQWYAKPIGGYETESNEALNNAVMAYSTLLSVGWTLNAVCALWGNVSRESVYNPWRWENDEILVPSNTVMRGYGLVGFTPSGKYINSSVAQGLEGYDPNYSGHNGSPDDGTAQLLFIDQMADWYPTPSYPMTFNEFKTSTEDVAYLTRAFLYNYERPADPSATVASRITAAEYWYNVLSGIIPPVPGPTGDRQSMPVWMMLKHP